jgi:hypothetical protein
MFKLRTISNASPQFDLRALRVEPVTSQLSGINAFWTPCARVCVTVYKVYSLPQMKLEGFEKCVFFADLISLQKFYDSATSTVVWKGERI